jgi:acetyl-CoA C-acetyltransferase
MTDAVIVSTARTPLCKSWRGALNLTHGAKMGGHVVHAALERAKMEPGEVEDVIIGCANPEGATGWNIARQIAMRAGLPISVPGMTVNRFCSSGLQTRGSWPAKATSSSPAASSRSRSCRTR